MTNVYQQLDGNTVATLQFVDNAGQPFVKDLKEELSFSEHTYNQDLMSQAPSYAWWSSVYVHAKQYLESSKLKLELVEADLGKHFRTVIETEGKKPTKDMITERIHTAPEYKEAREVNIWWETRVLQLQYVVKALEQRNNALTQFGAQMRSEIQSQHMRTGL